MNIHGRPLKFKSVKELQAKIDDYFSYREANNLPFTITGLAIWLDTSRETLMNYEKKDDYFDTIKRAKEKCAGYAEDQVFTSRNPAGAIFVLKNYGWSDKQEHDVTTHSDVITVKLIDNTD